MTKKALLILVLAAISSIFMFPVVAQADDVHWQLQFPDNTVQVQDSQPAETTCYAVPCPLTGKITDPQGRTVTSVHWYPDSSGSFVNGAGTDWSGQWSYPETGTYNPAIVVHYSDGTQSRYGVTVRVVDPANYNTQEKYVGPTTLYQNDPAHPNQDVFQVDYTGTDVQVQIGRQGETGRIGLTSFQQWNTVDGWHHELFRITGAPQGQDVIDMFSGDKAIHQNVTVVGAPPPPPDFTNVKVDLVGQKQGQAKNWCGLATRVTATGKKPASATVSDHLDGKLPNGKWTVLAKKAKSSAVAAGYWQFRVGPSFGLKQGKVADYLKHKANFRFVVDQAMIKKQNGVAVLNITRKTYGVPRADLGACKLAKTVFTAASL